MMNFRQSYFANAYQWPSISDGFVPVWALCMDTLTSLQDNEIQTNNDYYCFPGEKVRNMLLSLIGQRTFKPIRDRHIYSFWSSFLWSENSHFCQKCPSLRPKKWHFWWQNQNSKTTFIVQTFPKYCRNGFYFMKLSLLSPILAKFQFCWFSGLFWAFFPCKKCKK